MRERKYSIESKSSSGRSSDDEIESSSSGDGEENIRPFDVIRLNSTSEVSFSNKHLVIFIIFFLILILISSRGVDFFGNKFTVMEDVANKEYPPSTAVNQNVFISNPCARKSFYRKANTYASLYIQHQEQLEPFGKTTKLFDLSRNAKVKYKRQINNKEFDVNKVEPSRDIVIPKRVLSFRRRGRFGNQIRQLSRLVVYALCSDAVVIIPQFMKSYLSEYNAKTALEKYFPIFYSYEDFQQMYVHEVVLPPPSSTGTTSETLSMKEQQEAASIDPMTLLPPVEMIGYQNSHVPKCRDNRRTKPDIPSIEGAISQTEAAILSALFGSPRTRLKEAAARAHCTELQGAPYVGVHVRWKKGHCVTLCKRLIWNRFPETSKEYKDISSDLTYIRNKVKKKETLEGLREQQLQALRQQQQEHQLKHQQKDIKEDEGTRRRVLSNTKASSNKLEEDVSFIVPNIDVINTTLCESAQYYEEVPDAVLQSSRFKKWNSLEDTHRDCELPSSNPDMAWPHTLSHCGFCWMQPEYVAQQIHFTPDDQAFSLYIASDGEMPLQVKKLRESLSVIKTTPNNGKEVLLVDENNHHGFHPQVFVAKDILDESTSTHSKFVVALDQQLLAMSDQMIFPPVSTFSVNIGRLRYALRLSNHDTASTHFMSTFVPLTLQDLALVSEDEEEVDDDVDETWLHEEEDD